MEIKEHFRLALRQGGVTRQEADQLIASLSEATLRRITRNDFDRSLIHPVLYKANRMLENDCACGGNMELDEAVNQILDNKKEMFQLMRLFCLKEPIGSLW